MAPTASLLVIDDDSILSAALSRHLTSVGFRVATAHDGLEGLHAFYDIHPDLVLLDAIMPGLDGWKTCQRIREMCPVPIIMLSTTEDEADCVRGLCAGADDYVPKPFGMREIEARIEAVLRRVEGGKRQGQALLRLDRDLVVDTRSCEVRRNGGRVSLTSTEARLLLCLAEKPGYVLSHREILRSVWGPEYVDNVDYTQLFIWRLRQKIEPDPRNPKYILTQRGIGYRMVMAQS